jgi:dihydroflavonol-4-reductase
VAESGARPADLRVFYRRGDPVDSLEGIPGLDLFPGDLLDRRDVDAACAGRHLIFHCAALMTFDPRLRSRQWDINVEGTRAVLDAAAHSPSLRRLVYTSTINVLGNPDGPGSRELPDPYTSRPRIHSFSYAQEILSFADAVHEHRAPPRWEKRIHVGYHDSKLAAQELVLRAAREDGLDAVSVLPGTFLGPGGTLDGSGQYIAAVRGNTMPAAIRVRIPFLHVEDVARCHMLAALRGTRGERYVATGREEDVLTLAGMAELVAAVIAERDPGCRVRRRIPEVPRGLAFAAAALSEAFSAISGRPCALPIATVRAAAFDTAYTHETATRELGWIPRRTFREAIWEALDWLQSRGTISSVSEPKRSSSRPSRQR